MTTQTSSPSHRPSVAVTLMALAIAGCGTLIVDFQIDADVGGQDAAGHAWQAPPDQFSVTPRLEGKLSPFSSLAYHGPVIDWSFGTGTLGFGGTVTNRTPSELCMRFDQARVSSNLHPQPTPLQVYSWTVRKDSKINVQGSADPRKRRDFTPPSLCLEPENQAYLAMGPDLSPIFPTGKMFNVPWRDDRPELEDQGVGNWFAISMPIEYAGRREQLNVRLTARASKARTSYY